MAQVRILIVETKYAILQKGHVVSHAKSALEVLHRFETDHGETLKILLLNDSPMLPSKGPDAASAMVEQLGLTELFDAPAQQVYFTKPTSPQVPPRSCFEDALRNAGEPVALDTTLFITGQADWTSVCQSYGMHVLLFSPISEAMSDFSNWIDAPLVIARRYFPEHHANLEIALKTYLATKHDMALVSLTSPAGSGPINCTAKAWWPLEDNKLSELRGVCVQLPVQLSMDLGERGSVQTTVTPPEPDVLTEVTQYVTSMYARGEIQMESAAPTPGQTHVLEIDASGRRRLVRERFAKQQ
jgi:hypothetical protein